MLDGVDLRQWSLSELRQKFGLVSPDVGLFHAAVRDTVAMIDPDLVPPVVSPLEPLVRRGLSDRRLGLVLVGVFAGLAKKSCTAVNVPRNFCKAGDNAS